MTLYIYTDGGSKGNPGPSAVGIAFFLDGKRISTFRKDIGIGTNNEAEYKAVIQALELVPELKKTYSFSSIQISSDSSLLVNQLNGVFKVKNENIRSFIFKIRILEQEINLPVLYRHIPREKNTLADALVNNTAM